MPAELPYEIRQAIYAEAFSEGMFCVNSCVLKDVESTRNGTFKGFCPTWHLLFDLNKRGMQPLSHDFPFPCREVLEGMLTHAMWAVFWAPDWHANHVQLLYKVETTFGIPVRHIDVLVPARVDLWWHDDHQYQAHIRPARRALWQFRHLRSLRIIVEVEGGMLRHDWWKGSWFEKFYRAMWHRSSWLPSNGNIDVPRLRKVLNNEGCHFGVGLWFSRSAGVGPLFVDITDMWEDTETLRTFLRPREPQDQLTFRMFQLAVCRQLLIREGCSTKLPDMYEWLCRDWPDSHFDLTLRPVH